MLDRFHSKFHRYNHFTLPVAGYIDSASDPIAAPQDPFQGDFHVVGVLSATFVEGRDSVRIGVGANRAFIVPTTLTAQRTYTLPNSSGVVILDTTISPYLSAANEPNYIQTGTVWVDSVSGNDSTGTRERSDKPFKTLGGAQVAAVNGDIIVVHPGTYTDAALGADGVHWLFEPGAIIVLSAPTQSLFTYNAKSYNVFGHARVVIQGNTSPTLGIGILADFGGSTGTDLYFEFDSVHSDSSAVLDPSVTTGLFRGTYGAKNVVIHGRSVYVPKYNIFTSVKNLNAGSQTLTVKFDQFAIAQNFFYDSGHRLSNFVDCPLVSASDYIYNDAGTNDAVDLFSLEAAQVYGAFNRTVTTGPFYVDALYFGVASRATGTWNTSSVGPLHLFVDTLSTALPFIVNSNTDFDLNTLTVAHSLSTQEYTISYDGSLSLKAANVGLTHLSSVDYSLLYTDGDASSLKCKIGEITDNTLAGYEVLKVDGASACRVVLEIERLTGDGDFYLHGTDLKSRISIKNASNTYFDLGALSASTDSIFHIDGVYRTLSATNIHFTAVSGHSNTKLYIQGGSIFENEGTYLMNLSAVEGDDVDIFALGTVFANTSAIDPTQSFVIQCGVFETSPNLVGPVF